MCIVRALRAIMQAVPRRVCVSRPRKTLGKCKSEREFFHTSSSFKVQGSSHGDKGDKGGSASAPHIIALVR